MTEHHDQIKNAQREFAWQRTVHGGNMGAKLLLIYLVEFSDIEGNIELHRDQAKDYCQMSAMRLADQLQVLIRDGLVKRGEGPNNYTVLLAQLRGDADVE